MVVPEKVEPWLFPKNVSDQVFLTVINFIGKNSSEGFYVKKTLPWTTKIKFDLSTFKLSATNDVTEVSKLQIAWFRFIAELMKFLRNTIFIMLELQQLHNNKISKLRRHEQIIDGSTHWICIEFVLNTSEKILIGSIKLA